MKLLSCPQRMYPCSYSIVLECDECFNLSDNGAEHDLDVSFWTVCDRKELSQTPAALDKTFVVVSKFLLMGTAREGQSSIALEKLRKIKT